MASVAAAVAVFYSLWSVALAVLFFARLRVQNDRLSTSVALVLPATGTLPGLEDRAWARRVLGAGWQIVYEPMAMVYHHHAETLAQIYTRAYREAVAVRRLDPEFAQSPARFVVNYLRGVQRDVRFVRKYGRPWRDVLELVPQRFVELLGTYRGVNAPAEARRDG